MAELLSCWSLTAGARVRSQASPYGICGGQTDTVTFFFLIVLLSSAVSIIRSMLNISSSVNLLPIL